MSKLKRGDRIKKRGCTELHQDSVVRCFTDYCVTVPTDKLPRLLKSSLLTPSAVTTLGMIGINFAIDIGNDLSDPQISHVALLFVIISV